MYKSFYYLDLYLPLVYLTPRHGSMYKSFYSLDLYLPLVYLTPRYGSMYTSFYPLTLCAPRARCGLTPLMKACRTHNIRAARLLMDSGAALDVQPPDRFEQVWSKIYVTCCEEAYVGGCRELNDLDLFLLSRHQVNETPTVESNSRESIPCTPYL